LFVAASLLSVAAGVELSSFCILMASPKIDLANHSHFKPSAYEWGSRPGVEITVQITSPPQRMWALPPPFY